MERNKTLTALANTEPVVGAQHVAAQKLQWFLSESSWDPAQVNRRRQELLMEGSATAPSSHGALVLDETGDRKWGDKTAHVGRQYLGSIGKVENGVVSVHSLWADERRYYPLEVEPYTPAYWFARGKADAAFRTEPQIALDLVQRVVQSQVPFRAVVADSFYGENEGFVEGLEQLELGYVLALKPSHAWWHPQEEIGSVEEVARLEPWQRQAPGAWQRLIRRFRGGRQEEWWVLEGQAGPYGPTRPQRLVIVTTWKNALILHQVGQPEQPRFADEAQGKKVAQRQKRIVLRRLARRAATSAGVAGAVEFATMVLASVVGQAPAAPGTGTP